MPGRQAFAAEPLGQRGQVGELHRLIAAHARHRRLAGSVTVGEVGDHRIGEPLLGVDHVVRDAEMIRHPARVVDVLAGAARALAAGGGAVIVELQRDADDLVAGLVQQPGDGAAVHTARHRDQDAH